MPFAAAGTRTHPVTSCEGSAADPRLSGERHVEALGGEAGEGGSDVEG